MRPVWSRISNPVESSDSQEAKSSRGKQALVLWLLRAQIRQQESTGDPQKGRLKFVKKLVTVISTGAHRREALDMRDMRPWVHNEAEHAGPHQAAQRQDGLLLHQVRTAVQVEAVFGEVKEDN